MSKELIFKGIATALITPFTEKGTDYPKFGKLIDWQIEEGINALVICGTTGESSTMPDDEHCEVLRFATERIAGRVPMIAGTGSNDTAYAIELTQFAGEIGADAALVVTPYYNKATQKGLVQHFTAIADASKIPLILYNVPSRTGVTIEPETYLALADHPKIAAIKEAGGNIAKAVKTMSLVSDKLCMYSGNDDEIVPLMSIGAMGCISVLSNILPKKTCEICSRFFAGDVSGAAALQFRYLPLVNALFSEVNPIPVKAAVAAMGFCENILRLPLSEMDEQKRQQMLTLMRAEGLRV